MSRINRYYAPTFWFVGAGEVLLRRVTPRRFLVALKHVEPT